MQWKNSYQSQITLKKCEFFLEIVDYNEEHCNVNCAKKYVSKFGDTRGGSKSWWIHGNTACQ